MMITFSRVRRHITPQRIYFLFSSFLSERITTPAISLRADCHCRPPAADADTARHAADIDFATADFSLSIVAAR
jgi:hypothetical protein